MGKTFMFHCCLCNESFERTPSFVYHFELIHKGEADNAIDNKIEKYRCLKCDKAHTSNSSILTHIEQKHTSNLIKCNQCDFQATRTENLKLHVEYEHEGKEWKFKCDKCDLKFKIKGELNIHIKVGHENFTFKCTEDGCDAQYATKSGLRYHGNKYHLLKEYPCKECDKTFPLLSHINRHVKEDHLKETRNCEHCEYTTTKYVNLKQHYINKHKIPRKTRSTSGFVGSFGVPIISKCSKCDFTTTDRSEMRKHKIVEHYNKNCPSCDKSYSQPAHLSIHIKTVHKGINIYKCKICTYETGYRAGFIGHMRTNHSISKYKCDICPSMFNLPSKLKEHIRSIHEGIRVPCIPCGKTFEFAVNYRRHKKGRNHFMMEKLQKENYLLNSETGDFSIKNEIDLEKKQTDESTSDDFSFTTSKGRNNTAIKVEEEKANASDVKIKSSIGNEQSGRESDKDENIKMIKKEENLRFICPLCDVEYSTSNEMFLHVSKH